VPNWVLAFNEQARAALLRLEPWLQEEVLDELDRLAHNPGHLRRAGASPASVADFTRDHEGRRHYVFLSIELDPAAKTLGLIDIGHHDRAI
jgi:hypothetical protein